MQESDISLQHYHSSPVIYNIGLPITWALQSLAKLLIITSLSFANPLTLTYTLISSHAHLKVSKVKTDQSSSIHGLPNQQCHIFQVISNNEGLRQNYVTIPQWPMLTFAFKDLWDQEEEYCRAKQSEEKEHGVLERVGFLCSVFDEESSAVSEMACQR